MAGRWRHDRIGDHQSRRPRLCLRGFPEPATPRTRRRLARCRRADGPVAGTTASDSVCGAAPPAVADAPLHEDPGSLRHPPSVDYPATGDPGNTVILLRPTEGSVSRL